MLTEFGAIAAWLARTNPDKQLLPADPEGEARVFEVMDYVVGTLHGQAFGRIFAPQKFEPPDVVHETLGLGQNATKKKGREMVDESLGILDRQLAGRDYVAGNQFTIADAALFYAERWAPQLKIDLPPALAAHFTRVKARPAVQRVLAVWGEL